MNHEKRSRQFVALSLREITFLRIIIVECSTSGCDVMRRVIDNEPLRPPQCESLTRRLQHTRKTHDYSYSICAGLVTARGHHVLHAMPLDVAGRLRMIPCTRLLRTTPPLTLYTQFGQELLSTFGTQIGEIALIPATGGLFTVELVSSPIFESVCGESSESGTNNALDV
jgi:hypothetical protein